MTIKTSAVARPALVTKAEPVTMPLALTRPGNTAERVTTAARSTGNYYGGGTGYYYGGSAYPSYSYYSGGPLPMAVTAHPGVLTRTRTRAAIGTVVTTTTTRTTRQRTAIAGRWLQLCRDVLADSVTTTA